VFLWVQGNSIYMKEGHVTSLALSTGWISLLVASECVVEMDFELLFLFLPEGYEVAL
jgi:hypothetical protein